jgi:hypothetical protein
VLAPTDDQRLLLQAALASGEVSSRAFEAWSRRTELDSLDVASQRVLPLLVRRFDEDPDSRMPSNHGDLLLDRCRKVARFTWLKSRVLMAEASAALRALADADVPAMVLKGAAVVHHDGGQVAWRPMDDVDVAVPTARADDALAALAGAGYDSGMPAMTAAELESWKRAHHGLPVIGPRGAEIDLHWHVLAGSSHRRADEEFWSRAVPAAVADVPCLATSREDTLVNVIAHALWSAGQPGLRWATDVTALVRSAPGAESPSGTALRWDQVVETARRHRIGIAVADALDLLRSIVGLEFPPDALRRLRRASVTEQVELWPRRDRTGAYRLPTAGETLVGAYQSHLRATVPPGQGARPRDVVGFLHGWWGADGPPERAGVESIARVTARVAAHGAFVAFGRPERLRHQLVPSRPAGGGLPVALGEELSFCLGGDGQPALGSGWSCPEPHGTWSVAAEPVVTVQLTDPPTGPLRCHFELGVFVTALRPRLTVDLIVDGVHRNRSTFDSPGPVEGTIDVDLPAGRVDASGQLRLRFVLHRPLTPDAARYGADNRTLGIALKTLRISSA